MSSQNRGVFVSETTRADSHPARRAFGTVRGCSGSPAASRPSRFLDKEAHNNYNARQRFETALGRSRTKGGEER